MSDVLYRATKYMNAEDALLARKEKPKKRERQEDAQQDRGRKMTRNGDQREDRRSKPPTERFTNFTPLTTPIDQVLMQIKDDTTLTWPGKLKGDPNKRSRDKYCHFHRDHDHDIWMPWLKVADWSLYQTRKTTTTHQQRNGRPTIGVGCKKG